MKGRSFVRFLLCGSLTLVLVLALFPIMAFCAPTNSGAGNVDGRGAGPTTFYFAEGCARPNFDTYFGIYSIEKDAQVSIRYMCGDGTVREQHLAVPANSRAAVSAKSFLGSGDTEAYDFSAKIHSLNDVPIIAERNMYFNYMGQWAGGHAVAGAREVQDISYFAEGTARPGFETFFCILNPGETDADMGITYMLGDGTTRQQALVVPAASRRTVATKDFLGSADSEAHDFAAEVRSRGASTVVERSMYFNYKGAWAGGHCVIGRDDIFTPTVAFAEGTTRPGFETYFCIQNISYLDAELDITYYLGDGTTRKQEITVPPESRKTVLANEFLGEGDDPSHDFAVAVRSRNPRSVDDYAFVVERSSYFNYRGAWTGGHAKMGEIADGMVWTAAIVMPMTQYFAGGSARPGYDTYVSIFNPYGEDDSAIINYRLDDGTLLQQSVEVPGYSRETVAARELIVDTAHDFSIAVSGLHLIAERAMYFNYGSIWSGGHTVRGTFYNPGIRVL